jgi:hypothetical protein
VKLGDALSPSLLNFALEYDIRNAKESEEDFKLNGTHQLLIYADDVDILVENITS